MKFPVVVLPLLAMSACADDPFDDKAASVEGIYRVDSHTRNETSCSPGGDAVEDTQTFAFAKRHDVLGVKMLDFMSCSDVVDCRAKSEKASFGDPISFGFALTAIDGDALTGVELGAGLGNADGTCKMPELTNLKLVMTNTTLQLESRTQIGADYMSANGTCSTAQARASAEAAPCSELETISATKIAEF
jgi:hypothetical protein